MLLISGGILTMWALEVAQDLTLYNIGVAVLHEPIVQSLDEARIVAAVGTGPRLVVWWVVFAKNRAVVGGLGEAMASKLLCHRVLPAEFQLAGLPDALLDAGALPTLHERHGISRSTLGGRIKAWLG